MSNVSKKVFLFILLIIILYAVWYRGVDVFHSAVQANSEGSPGMERLPDNGMSRVVETIQRNQIVKVEAVLDVLRCRLQYRTVLPFEAEHSLLYKTKIVNRKSQPLV